MKLTEHQKATVAAFYLLATNEDAQRTWRNDDSGWWRRADASDVIRRMSYARYPPSVTRKQIARLREMGLVEPESELTVRLVEDGVCMCGCDRWRITETGKVLAGAWSLVLPTRRSQIDA